MKLKVLNRQPRFRPRYPVFCRVKNEMYFLPHFLQYHRTLGVDHFFFADDRSTDGSREYLLDQPDCTVVEPELGYGDHKNGVKVSTLMMSIIPEHIIGPGWIITLDADELLILPPQYESVAALVSHLEENEQVSCAGTMVDFYPPTLDARNVSINTNPLDAFPWFDRGPYFVMSDGHAAPFPLHAGVRYRLAEWLYADSPEMFKEIYPKGWWPVNLSKVPLVKWGGGICYKNDHQINGRPYTGHMVALAHFKFYPGLDEKIAYAISSNTYAFASKQYKFLDLVIRQFSERSLLALVTRRYTGPDALKNAALLY